jgi:hypothetical protein
MEQMIGTPPYRFEVEGPGHARSVEFERKGLFGQWTKPRRRIRWISCKAVESDEGTRVTVEASGGKGPLARALQVVELLTEGVDDPRTIYRRRVIPPGPVTLVASWAGMPYRLFTEPRFDAPRGAEIFTATRLEAIPGGRGVFCKVRLEDGREGYVEKDQIVVAPKEATREAQVETAHRYV